MACDPTLWSNDPAVKSGRGAAAAHHNTARGPYIRPLHPLVPGPAPALAGGPAGAQHIGRLAVHTVRRVDAQHAVHFLVHTGWTDVRVEAGQLRRDVLADDQVRGNRVARRIAGLEHGVDLAEGELPVGRDPRARARGQ